MIDTDDMELESAKDPIAVKGPEVNAPLDEASIDMNPITGYAHNIDFAFERYSSSKVEHAVIEISTDEDFEGIFYTSPDIDLTRISGDSKAVVIGPTSPDDYVAALNPGQTYYWRVRTISPWLSAWSETRSFIVESTTVFTVKSPEIGEIGVSVMPTLSWAAHPGAKGYGYDIQITDEENWDILEQVTTVVDPFYPVTEPLKYSTTYYWRVRALLGPVTWDAKGRPVPPTTTDWTTGVFTTEAIPEEPEPPIVIEPTPPTEVKVVEVPVQGPPQAIPDWMLLTIIGIGAVLVIALIVLIVRTRRVV
jgi:hypothetical protein